MNVFILKISPYPITERKSVPVRFQTVHDLYVVSCDILLCKNM